MSARTSINSSVGLTAETTAVGGSTRCTPSGPTSTRMGWPVCGRLTRPRLGGRSRREHEGVGRAPREQPPVKRWGVGRRVSASPTRRPWSSRSALVLAANATSTSSLALRPPPRSARAPPARPALVRFRRDRPRTPNVRHRVERDEEAQRLRFLGSPTVRVDGRDVEPRGRCTRGLRSQVPAVPHRRWVDRHTGGGMAGGGHSRRPRLRQRRPGGRQMLRRSNAVAYHHQQCPGDARAHDEPRLGPTRSAPSVGARAACVHGRRRPPSAAARGRLLPGSLIARTRHQGKEPT